MTTDYFREVFAIKQLLLIGAPNGRLLWVSPHKVRYNTPSFVKFTVCYPGIGTASIYNDKIKYLFNISQWTAEYDLEPELCRFATAVQANIWCIGDWAAICAYVYNALKCLLPLRQNNILVQHILRLGIYPIGLSKPGFKTISRLHQHILAPDSPSLNAVFYGKVDFLDFECFQINAIHPLLRLANPPLKFISDYDNDNDIEVSGISSRFDQYMEKIRIREYPLTR
jgi:hypothetical protein